MILDLRSLFVIFCLIGFGDEGFIPWVLGSAPVKKRLEDVMPIATGLEREEIEAELQVCFSSNLFVSHLFG
jgi:hypothetical protein